MQLVRREWIFLERFRKERANTDGGNLKGDVRVPLAPPNAWEVGCTFTLRNPPRIGGVVIPTAPIGGGQVWSTNPRGKRTRYTRRNVRSHIRQGEEFVVATR